MKRIESGKLTARHSPLLLIKTPADGRWIEAFETAASSSVSFCLHPMMVSHSSTCSPSLSFLVYPSITVLLTLEVLFCLWQRRGGCCCRARSLSFISPHEGNITGISLQEGCANTTTTPAHYRVVKRCLQPSLQSHSFALTSATPVRDLLPHMRADWRNINYPTVQLQSDSIAEWAQGLLNSGQPCIRSY